MSTNILRHLYNFRRVVYPLNTTPLPITELPLPSILTFPLDRGKIAVKIGDKINPGHPLGEVSGKQSIPSPVKGEVQKIGSMADIRGGRTLPAISIEPAADTVAIAFSALKVTAKESTLKERIEKAGVMTDAIEPQPLLDALQTEGESEKSVLLILAIDREPGVSASLQLFRERDRDAGVAAKMLGRIAKASKVLIVVPKALEQEATRVCKPEDVAVMSVAAVYPESLENVLAMRTGGKVRVITLETAFAALDAVREGKVQDRKVLTVIGPKGAIGNYRAYIGTQFKEILDSLGLSPKEHDKVVAGGPMRGFAQYSLEGTVDAGVDALMLISDKSIVKWSNEPCINCGNCTHICPVNLQVQLINRYSEFGLFEQAGELGVAQCIECGLCASVCTARRPLWQLIDLAKKALGEEKKKDCGKVADHAIEMYSDVPKFTVGPSPHWRTKSSITRINLAFLLALLPTAFLGAIIHSFGARAVELNASFGPIGKLLKILVIEMGVNTGVLWLFGVLGILAIGMGTGILVEYICQVAMRQPYHASNGHGALIGLLVALLMPPTVPFWVLMVAVTMAIFIGKQIFGGIGSYPMHPALVGWLIVLLSWPHYLYPIGSASIAAPHAAVVILTLAGGLVLVALGYISLRIPVSLILSVVVFSFLFQGKLNGSIAEQLFTGHVFLAAFFLATDPTCSPANKLGMWIHGLGTGLLIVLIRAYGIWPDAIPFAVLLMNIVHPLVDRIRPRVKQGAV